MSTDLWREFRSYLEQSRKSWLGAFVLVLVLVGVLCVFAAFGDVIGPFIYDRF